MWPTTTTTSTRTTWPWWKPLVWSTTVSPWRGPASFLLDLWVMESIRQGLISITIWSTSCLEAALHRSSLCIIGTSHKDCWTSIFSIQMRHVTRPSSRDGMSALGVPTTHQSQLAWTPRSPMNSCSTLRFCSRNMAQKWSLSRHVQAIKD